MMDVYSLYLLVGTQQRYTGSDKNKGRHIFQKFDRSGYGGVSNQKKLS